MPCGSGSMSAVRDVSGRGGTGADDSPGEPMPLKLRRGAAAPAAHRAAHVLRRLPLLRLFGLEAPDPPALAECRLDELGALFAPVVPGPAVGPAPHRDVDQPFQVAVELVPPEALLEEALLEAARTSAAVSKRQRGGLSGDGTDNSRLQLCAFAARSSHLVWYLTDHRTSAEAYLK